MRTPTRLHTALAIAWAFALLGSCREYTPLPAAVTCDPRSLDPGEVRVRQIPCNDELISGGDGRRNDFLLENSLARQKTARPPRGCGERARQNGVAKVRDSTAAGGS